MMGPGTKALIAIAIIMLPGVSLAQTAPLPAGEMRGGPHAARIFGNVSPEGRAVLHQAMRDHASQSDRQALRDARDRVAVLLSAETLDVRALKLAMDAERKLVDAQQAKRQASMLAAFQKLSHADRKAFVEDAARGRHRLQRMVQPDAEIIRMRRLEKAPE
jgi:uncharacterized membrane protein